MSLYSAYIVELTTRLDLHYVRITGSWEVHFFFRYFFVTLILQLLSYSFSARRDHRNITDACAEICGLVKSIVVFCEWAFFIGIHVFPNENHGAVCTGLPVSLTSKHVCLKCCCLCVIAWNTHTGRHMCGLAYLPGQLCLLTVCDHWQSQGLQLGIGVYIPGAGYFFAL